MSIAEKNLWQILKEQYGFKPHVYEVAANSYQEFREFWLPTFWLKLFPLKKIKKSSDDWLISEINNNTYEVMMVDIWYVELRKNGVAMFSERRFENEDFLKLLA